MKIVLIYLGMLIFDFAVFGGTAFLVSERGWSGWWFLLAILVASGSNPTKVVRLLAKGEK